jgi:hypothetical protein
MSAECETLILIEQHVKLINQGSGKPSYDFGASGAAPALTWLDSHGRPSNKTGIPFGLDNGKLIEIWVGNELLVEYEFSLYWHEGDETNLTLLKSVTVPAANRTATFDQAAIGDIDVPKDKQIAGRITAVTATNPRNVGAYAIITGTFT